MKLMKEGDYYCYNYILSLECRSTIDVVMINVWVILFLIECDF